MTTDGLNLNLSKLTLLRVATGLLNRVAREVFPERVTCEPRLERNEGVSHGDVQKQRCPEKGMLQEQRE